MERRIPKLIFDTSAINALAKEADVRGITEAICIAYHFGITETVLSEIVADPEGARRNTRLDVLKRLLGWANA
jgi:rRNA-processing protein FCF1